MRNLKLWLIGAIMIVGVAVSLVIQRQSQLKFREKEDLLRQQDSHLAELAAEHQRLSNLVAQTNGSPVDGQMADLVRLRSEAEGLRKQINALAKQPEQNRRPRASPTASRSESHPPEYYQQLHELAGGKDRDAMTLGMALQMYASEQQSQIPSSWDQVAPYLRKDNMSLTGTNEFEIVYQGSLDRLKNIPLGSVALIRDRQAWLAPSGKMAKVYGMANGAGLIVESDDNFQSWEAEHIIPPPSSGR
jgi:uncharacterized protein YdcH (DUF465 family)